MIGYRPEAIGTGVADFVRNFEVLENNPQMATHGLARALRHLDGEWAIWQANQKGREAYTDQPPMLQSSLHIGCGTNILPGFTNLDIFPNQGVDVVADAREGLPFDDNQFKFVFSEHMLEHVDYPRSARHIVSEMLRVTRPGGKVVIGVPDSRAVLRAYAEEDQDLLEEYRERWYARRTNVDQYQHPIDLVRLVVADEDDDPQYTPHLWAYDRDNLGAMMEASGLQSIIDWEHTEISLQKRQWGALYLEGLKGSK